MGDLFGYEEWATARLARTRVFPNCGQFSSKKHGAKLNWPFFSNFDPP